MVHEDADAVADLLEAAFRFAPTPGESVAEVRRTAALMAGDPVGSAIAVEGDLVVGVTRPSYALLTVHPEHRRRGHGSRLFAAAIDIVRAEGLHELELFVPATGPGRPFAERHGLVPGSSLWLLRLPADAAGPTDGLPAGFVGRAIRPDDDFEAYLHLINASFADHPSPMSWTPEFIRHAHALPEFDPDDTHVVASADDPDRLVAFCRVTRMPADRGGLVGSIRLLGTLPEARRLGIGRALLGWGIARLRATGAAAIDLTVEARNEQALGLYRRAGFEPVVEWPHWRLDIGASD